MPQNRIHGRSNKQKDNFFLALSDPKGKKRRLLLFLHNLESKYANSFHTSHVFKYSCWKFIFRPFQQILKPFAFKTKKFFSSRHLPQKNLLLSVMTFMTATVMVSGDQLTDYYREKVFWVRFQRYIFIFQKYASE